MTHCHLCGYYRDQLDRLHAEVLDLRLQVADGPRARVNELERTVEALNARIEINNRRRAS